MLDSSSLQAAASPCSSKSKHCINGVIFPSLCSSLIFVQFCLDTYLVLYSPKNHISIRVLCGQGWVRRRFSLVNRTETRDTYSCKSVAAGVPPRLQCLKRKVASWQLALVEQKMVVQGGFAASSSGTSCATPPWKLTSSDTWISLLEPMEVSEHRSRRH